MTGEERVRIETGDAGLPEGVAVLRLDRPPLNVLDARLQDQLIAACRTVDLDRSVRAVVLHGGERAFAAGADIKEFAPRTQADQLVAGDGISRTASAVAGIGKPVIAAVEGYALGGGLEIAVAADFRVSSATATWGLPEVLLGLMPAAGGTQRLPRIVGAAAAKRVMFLGENLTGAEARDIGLVDEITRPGAALEHAIGLAARLASMPPLALRAMKQAVDRSFELPLDAGIEFERQLCLAVFATNDRVRGVESFLQHGPGAAHFLGD